MYRRHARPCPVCSRRASTTATVPGNLSRRRCNGERGLRLSRCRRRLVHRSTAIHTGSHSCSNANLPALVGKHTPREPGGHALCNEGSQARRAASAPRRSSSQRAKSPRSGVSNPASRYTVPFMRTVSPSMTSIGPNNFGGRANDFNVYRLVDGTAGPWQRLGLVPR